MRWRCWPRTFTHSLASAAGFNRLSDSALLGFGIDPASLHDVGSGFRAGIYSNDKQYVLAFAGTNDWRDWLSNVRQATGYDDVQYNQAVAAAKAPRRPSAMRW